MKQESLARVNRFMSAPQCEYDPMWYDCARLQCADCPERMCSGGCGQMNTDCDCPRRPHED